MSYTFAELTLALYETVDKPYEGTATGGNATTVVDANRAEVDATFTNGTIWMLSGNNVGKSRKVTSWSLTTHTFTFATMTLVNAAGNLYKAGTYEFPYEDLRAAVNRAYTSLYRVPDTFDSATFITVAEQESYALPTISGGEAANVYDVKRVEIASNTTSPYEWRKNFHWTEKDGRLYFDHGHIPDEAGYRIRLHYIKQPAALSGDTDTTHDLVHIDRLRWDAAVVLLTWKRNRDQDSKWLQLLNYALQKQVEMARLHPVPYMQRDPHFGG